MDWGVKYCGIRQVSSQKAKPVRTGSSLWVISPSAALWLGCTERRHEHGCDAYIDSVAASCRARLDSTRSVLDSLRHSAADLEQEVAAIKDSVSILNATLDARDTPKAIGTGKPGFIAIPRK